MAEPRPRLPLAEHRLRRLAESRGRVVTWPGARLFAEVEGSRSAELAEVSDGAGKAGPGAPFPNLLRAPDSLGFTPTVPQASLLFPDSEACPPLTLF